MKPEKFFGFVLDLSRQFEGKRIANNNEADRVLQNIQKDIRAITLANIKDLDSIMVGTSKILSVTARNGRVAMKAGSRAGQRIAAYRRMFMDNHDSLHICDVEPGCFGRFVSRLESPFDSFYGKTGQPYPTKTERKESRLIWMADAESSLLKLENTVKSQVCRNIRSVYTGRMRPSQALKAARSWKINKGHFRLLLSGIAEATVRFMNSRNAKPEQHFVVALGPKQEEKTTLGSRVHPLLWKVMTAKELDKWFSSKNNLKKSTSTSWRGLGVGPNSGEFYVPIPEDIVEEVEPMFKERRTALFAQTV